MLQERLWSSPGSQAIHRQIYAKALWFFQKDTYCLEITHTLQTLTMFVYMCVNTRMLTCMVLLMTKLTSFCECFRRFTYVCKHMQNINPCPVRTKINHFFSLASGSHHRAQKRISIIEKQKYNAFLVICTELVNLSYILLS